jgi:Flp pilus assembly pilin Flp
MTKFMQFMRDDSGATAIEYGLIAALIAVVIIAAVRWSVQPDQHLQVGRDLAPLRPNRYPGRSSHRPGYQETSGRLTGTAGEFAGGFRLSAAPKPPCGLAALLAYM